MNNNSILLLDDDNAFRGYLCSILNSRGLNVIEAGNAREANMLLQSGNPAMAIVDFRLPGQDGFSWIASVRDANKNFPVVVLSGTWCDEKTFNRLRNILRVSLILRKPIAADLFIQQIESLLPAHLFMPANNYAEESVEEAYYEEATESASEYSEPAPSEPTADQASPAASIARDAADGSSSGARGPGIVETANFPAPSYGGAPTVSLSAGDVPQEGHRKMRSKAEKQERLQAARVEYGIQLNDHWSELVKALTAARQEPTNATLTSDAVYIAHRLRGTAGSIGFPGVSEAAGKIEDMMHHLDPTDTLQEVIWTEIFRWLADGELAARAGVKECTSGLSESSGDASTEQEEPKRDPFYKKVLLWGNKAKYKNFGVRRDMKIEITDSLPQLLNLLAIDSYSGVFIDLSVADQGETLMGAKEIRAMHSGDRACLPLGCVMPAFDVLPEELVYAGFSVVLQNGATEQEIEWACKRLTSMQQNTSARILTVDDDEVLTNFIATVLGSEGMEVQTLNKPILIFDALEEFKPDIILLDVMMPGLSGYDVCRMLRSDDNWKHLAIVFLTSKSDQEGRAAAFQAGGDDFLSKPVLAEELLARVSAQAERKKIGPHRDDGGIPGTISGAQFMKEATGLLEKSQSEKQPLTLCLISIDDFGEISINHGMQSASHALRLLANLTITHFKADVLRGRIGEEGIVLAFPGETQATVGMALQIMLSEFQEFEIESEYAQHPFKCTFSAGVGQSPDNGQTVHKILSTANQKLMTGRRGGRGVIRYANPDTALTPNG